MSAAEQKTQAAGAATTVAGASLLEQAISATKQTERSQAQEMVKTLVAEVTKGTVSWSRNVSRTIKLGIEAIDAVISKQLAAIMHHPDFQKLEGSWRGLNYLVMNTETSAQLKIKLLNVSKRDLFKDLDRAVEFDQSQVFKKLYENEFGSPGGEPYGALVGDYEITNHPEDIDLLTKMSNISAAAFAPFITAASHALLGLDSYTELAKPRDLEKIFDSVEYTSWKSFRDSEDSRFVTMAMPRVLSRLPYGANTKPIEEFGFEEVTLDSKGKAKKVAHEHYCWMNAAYVLGARLTDSFAKNGWCTSIRGAENGGKVEGLPAHVFTSDDGDPDLMCPTEIGITDRREAELSKLGFLPLCHYKNTDYSVFFGAQTAQRPKKYDRPAATANAAISARLPYIMATGRIAHYLKVIARDKIGSFMEASDCQEWLNRWIANYICADAKPTAEMKAKYPLAEAKIEVKEVPGAPGSYNAVAWLRPWLQMEELTTSLRMVASIPKLSS
ncbi:MAG: type VI secretion system contractile sheath large subunit [Phycisphaerales bacterium]|nr:type VI secretion system contractile sheath large subunit [Phycisphaerales bacterium]MCI0629489.1 type VI secretion system contractile sheath large subunit [Phycisphaerales bacterium]MCI0674741.1 type VI secretion system contractile sheath large subunit [Phycisphaerales bacterium]